LKVVYGEKHCHGKLAALRMDLSNLCQVTVVLSFVHQAGKSGNQKN
jgi:hypothetical protein